jgi:hypothetical protein
MPSAPTIIAVTEGTRARRLAVAMRVALWLSVLPACWHRYDFPQLMRRLDAARVDVVLAGLDRRVLAQIVQRVARLRLFSLPLFPRQCLRESLALYHVLTAAGESPQLLVGVRKDAGSSRLRAHSWVNLKGVPIVRGDCGHGFHVVFRHSRGVNDDAAMAAPSMTLNGVTR